MHVMTPGTLRPEEKVKVEGLLCNPSTILMEKPGASPRQSPSIHAVIVGG